MPGIKRTVTQTFVGVSHGKAKRPRSGAGPRKKKSMQKQQYGQEGPEMKFLDTTSSTVAAVTGVVVGLTTMAQGLTNSTRVGNKVAIKSVAVRISAYPFDTNADVQANNHKWSLVLDKEPEAGAVASYNQIYTGNSVQAFNNINYSDRFVIMATGTWSHGAREIAAGTTWSDGGEMSKYVDAYRHCDVNAKYILTTATQSAISSNQLLFCLISENTDANVAIDANMRIRFTDE